MDIALRICRKLRSKDYLYFVELRIFATPFYLCSASQVIDKIQSKKYSLLYKYYLCNKMEVFI